MLRKISSPPEPWQDGLCGRNNCQLCCQPVGRQNDQCWGRSCTYSITCKPCQEERIRACYVGETSDMFRRAEQHFKGLARHKHDSVLFQHAIQHHPHLTLDRKDYDLEVTRHHSTPISRQAEEGTRIMWELAHRQGMVSPSKGESYEKLVLLNSRSEFHQPLGGIKTCTSYL